MYNYADYTKYMIKHETLAEDKFSSNEESNSSESEDELSSTMTNYKGI